MRADDILERCDLLVGGAGMRIRALDGGRRTADGGVVERCEHRQCRRERDRGGDCKERVVSAKGHVAVGEERRSKGAESAGLLRSSAPPLLLPTAAPASVRAAAR